MDTQVQPSFIPKKPLTGSNMHASGAAFGMFFVLVSILFFIASLCAAGGAFVFKNILQSSIVTKSDTLQKAEAAFDPSTIQDLVRLDSRINNTEALLQKHSTVISVFNFLAQQTLQNVQFTSFSYDLQNTGAASISLNGVADGFATVALQSDQLGASKLLKNVVFSGIVVNGAGQVTFSVRADVDPSLLSYAKNLATSPGGASPSPSPSPSNSAPTPAAASTNSAAQGLPTSQ